MSSPCSCFCQLLPASVSGRFFLSDKHPYFVPQPALSGCKHEATCITSWLRRLSVCSSASPLFACLLAHPAPFRFIAFNYYLCPPADPHTATPGPECTVLRLMLHWRRQEQLELSDQEAFNELLLNASQAEAAASNASEMEVLDFAPWDVNHTLGHVMGITLGHLPAARWAEVCAWAGRGLSKTRPGIATRGLIYHSPLGGWAKFQATCPYAPCLANRPG